MVNHIPTNADMAQEEWNQTLNIAGNEISAVLDIDEPYAIAREKFEFLRNYCIEILEIDQDPIYKKIMNHYLRNSWNYVMCPNFKASTNEEIHEYQKDYTTFLSIISRITQLTEKQKKSFLKQMESHYTAPQTSTDETENPIDVMNRVLSIVLA